MMGSYVWRTLIASFGVCTIAWAAAAIPAYRSDAPLSDAAQSILSNEKFSAAQLSAMKLQLNAAASTRPVQASALSGAVVIRLLLLEDELKASNRQPSASDIDEFQMLVSDAIARSPTNSFMWLTDFWLKRLRPAPDADLNLLRMSYWSGPNEAWIAVKRNPLALGIFTSLPSELAEQAISEFVGLMSSGLYADTANILAGPGWNIRDQLLTRLSQVKLTDRRMFAKALASIDIDDVAIPGVDERPSRPF
jgi:hypothetical protein